MQKKLEAELQVALEKITTIDSIKELSTFKNSFVANMMGEMRNVSKEDKPIIGKFVNILKEQWLAAVAKREQEIENLILKKEIENDRIDISLSPYNVASGALHPIQIVINDLTSIAESMGFIVVNGPEIETDTYNFEMLNIPSAHPARDMQDTFYINESLLLRTHTSPTQIRMLTKANEANAEVLAIVSPGKVYRRDNDDATHSHQFTQMEGLYVAKGVNMGHLKGTLELFVKKLFGQNREIKLRSSYFPFTEPSVEVDVSCFNCGSKGCNICKGTGWIEILGAGMVHPQVLENCGYDSNIYSGFAFGVGIERLAMLRYGVDDIRNFYINDERFLKQFVRKF